MDRIVQRACGLDVHRDTVCACVRVPGGEGAVEEIIRTFGTTTGDLLALRDWLESLGVTDVAMESTGALWKPVYYVLEDRFRVMLVNAAHMKNVPGRKTDVKDCAWIAQLLEHGLLRPSFVPPPPIRELRDLTRYRKVLSQERTREVQRLHKVLQDAGIKLSSVATDIMGVSGRAMIEALMEGTTDARVLAELAKGTLRRKLPELRKALEGKFRAHHAFLAGHILAHVDYLEETQAEITRRIGEMMRPFAEEIERLDTIPGVNRKTAEVIVSEMGVDMQVFPSAQHLASWAGLCPGNNESAGKHRSGKTRKGSQWLRTALVEAAQAAARTRDTYLAAQYRRIVKRRGHKKAIVAVAHTILVIAYHLISKAATYEDLGAGYFENRQRDAIRRRCVAQLERLGLQVTLTEKEVA